MTLYVDILFAINFSMDFLALFICSIILHKKTTKFRIVLSALIGATFGVLAVIFSFGVILELIFSIICSFVMCLVAFLEKNLKRLLLTFITFWVISMGLGGIMSLLYSLLNKLLYKVIDQYSQSTAYNGSRFFIIASITAIVAIVFSRIFASKKDIKTVDVTIELEKETYKFTALCDSGNILTEPISSKPVILVSSISKIGNKIKDMDERLKRYIPFSDVSGKGLIQGVIPKRVIVGDNLVDAVIAPIERKKFADYEGLVPTALL